MNEHRAAACGRGNGVGLVFINHYLLEQRYHLKPYSSFYLNDASVLCYGPMLYLKMNKKSTHKCCDSKKSVGIIDKTDRKWYIHLHSTHHRHTDRNRREGLL